MRRAILILAVGVSTAAYPRGWVDTLRASPCLTGKKGTIALSELREGTHVSIHRDRSKPIEAKPFVVCHDDALDPARVIAIGRGLALMIYADPLSPLPLNAKNRRELRRFAKEDAGQVGCLKKLKVGTALFDAPAGEMVGAVIDGSIPYGRWDYVETASTGWSKLRVNVGFGPLEVWMPDGPAEWCPE
jgi:hypothetical protein